MSNGVKKFDGEALIAKYPKQERPLRQLYARIAELSDRNREIVQGTLLRYTEEAENDSYRIEPSGLIGLMRDQNLLKGSDKLYELGPGPGQTIEELAPLYPDLDIRGVELSPGFVQKFTDRNGYPNASMSVGMIDAPLAGIEAGNRSSGLSVLTLDRLSDPLEMIRQMGRLNRARIIGTILPINPVDDDPSRKAEGRVYTAEDKRIVPGRNAAEDRDELWNVLKREWRRNVEIATVKYGITSSNGDKHNYDLEVFYAS